MAAGGGGAGAVNLGLNANVFISQMNNVVNTTNTFNNQIQQTTNQLNQFNQAANAAGGATANLGNGLGSLNGQLALLSGLGAVQALINLQSRLASATQEAAEFSRSVGLIQTITAGSGLSLAQWADGIRQVSDALGTPLLETSAGAYDLLSNQITKAADTFTTLTAAGNLAKITNSSVTDSVNSLSSVINAYGYSSADTEMLAAKLFTTVDLGRVKLNELESQIGRVAETGKSLGVSFEETNAALIAMTNTGIKTNTSMTLLVNLEQKLLKPTKELQEVYDELGVGTGDVFIKMNTLAGAIEILSKRAGGSQAVLSKWFNEIRGSQAFQVLTDQMDAYKNGLAEQDTALERSRKALEAYNNTPGAKFQVEAQQLANELTTGFKTDLLEAVVKITGAFGGLKKTMLELYQAAFLIGGAITGWQVTRMAGHFAEVARAADAARLATLGLTAAQAGAQASVGAGALALAAPLAMPAAVALITAGLVHQYQVMQEVKEESAHLYEAFGEAGDELTRKNQEDDAKSRASAIEGTRKQLEEQQRLVLAYTVEQRKNLTRIGDGLDEVGAKLGDSLKNSVELVLKSAKDGLKEVESRLAKALSNASAAQKAMHDVSGNRGDALFNVRRAQDQAETGGANERGILQRRLDELNKEMAAASRRGDLEGFNKAHGKAEGILGEAATATDQDGNLKYYGAVAATNELYDNQLAYLKQIEAVNLRNAEILTKQKAILSSQVEEAVDAGKALTSFKLTDSKGDSKYKSTDEALAAYDAKKKEFDAKTAAVNKNPLAGGDFRGANALAQDNLFAERRRKLEEDSRGARGNIGDRQDHKARVGEIDTLGASASRITDVAIKRVNEAADLALRRGQDAGDARTRSTQSLAALAGDNALYPRTADDTKAKTDALIGEVNRAADRGDYDAANARLNQVEAQLKKLETYDQDVMVTGRRDGDNNIVNKTGRAAVGEARQDLAYREQAATKAASANLAFAQLSEAVPKVVGSLTSLAGGITDALERIRAIAAANEATVQRQANRQVNERLGEGVQSDQSHGGFAGYFSSGGTPRGIDTVNAMVSPGEFIMNPQSSARFKSQLVAMNSGWDSGSRGGATTNVGDIHVHVSGGSSSQATVQEIAAGLNRGIRQGTIRLGR